MTRTTPELAPSSSNFHATPTGGRLSTTYDLKCNRPENMKSEVHHHQTSVPNHGVNSQYPSPNFKTQYYSNRLSLVMSQMAFHFTTLRKTAIHPDYFIFHKRRFRDSSQPEVHLLYSPKNMTLSTPGHVGDSVNQRLCSATPAVGMVTVTK
ncbi:hypothetical protein AVEN_80436-1 [Araneus ventricosus]|uniref:Uncharacterized protein n=1 Tax=Araneus ventricosus TaxID=182803 RepID=A0A4Y2NZN2_ARAVE|nr:hypothetical protein AVEN_80436-1 [Araneus ventricosus]